MYHEYMLERDFQMGCSFAVSELAGSNKQRLCSEKTEGEGPRTGLEPVMRLNVSTRPKIHNPIAEICL